MTLLKIILKRSLFPIYGLYGLYDVYIIIQKSHERSWPTLYMTSLACQALAQSSHYLLPKVYRTVTQRAAAVRKSGMKFLCLWRLHLLSKVPQVQELRLLFFRLQWTAGAHCAVGSLCPSPVALLVRVDTKPLCHLQITDGTR